MPDCGITPLPADVAMRYGLHDARGYDYPIVDRYDALWRRAVTEPEAAGFIPPTTLASTTPKALRALGLLGVSQPDAAGRQALPLRGRLRRPGRADLRQPAGAAACVGSGAPRTSRRPALRRDAPVFDPRRSAVLAGGAG